MPDTKDTGRRRVVNLVLRDQDGLDCRTTILGLVTALPTSGIVPAVEAACQEYAMTRAGRETYEYNCSCFNFGDFIEYVPDEICRKHGIEKLDSDDTETLDEDFNRHLVDDDALAEHYESMDRSEDPEAAHGEKDTGN